jgi:hypothetical protein
VKELREELIILENSVLKVFTEVDSIEDQDIALTLSSKLSTQLYTYFSYT